MLIRVLRLLNSFKWIFGFAALGGFIGCDLLRSGNQAHDRHSLHVESLFVLIGVVVRRLARI